MPAVVPRPRPRAARFLVHRDRTYVLSFILVLLRHSYHFSATVEHRGHDTVVPFLFVRATAVRWNSDRRNVGIRSSISNEPLGTVRASLPLRLQRRFSSLSRANEPAPRRCASSEAGNKHIYPVVGVSVRRLHAISSGGPRVPFSRSSSIRGSFIIPRDAASPSVFLRGFDVSRRRVHHVHVA